MVTAGGQLLALCRQVVGFSRQSTLNKKVYSKECVSKSEQMNIGVLVMKVADAVVKGFPSHILYRFQ